MDRVTKDVSQIKILFRRFITDYGIIFVLLLLCLFYSAATWREQQPEGEDAAKSVVKQVLKQYGKEARPFIVTGKREDQVAYANDVSRFLKEANITPVGTVSGEPYDVREALNQLVESQQMIDVLIVTKESARWKFLTTLDKTYPTLAGTKMVKPEKFWFPDFLKRSNIMAIADRIVVIALIAIGMTMVIITTGIDLSVGSLIALSAVVWTLFIRDYAGAENAAAFGMILSALAAILLCSLSGIFSAIMVTKFMIPPFIVTLAMMMVASGLAFIFAEGQSIYQVPPSLTWLGRGATLFGIPNTIILMILFYAAAHILMTRTILGRYIYAVGGNKEAARLSGVPVNLVLLFVYAITGALAGLGGIVQASQLQSGAPTYGVSYELYVIAAVVVGGTSLAGGEGKILGTLIGAFIIAVIQNGMNLTGVESYTQKVVLGLVILGAVLLDMMKKQGVPLGRFLKFFRRAQVSSAS